MLNIKTKFGTFQILGKEEFSKRTEGRFTLSNFLIQLFFSPLFKTTIGYVNANLRQVSNIFYVLDENIFVQLDQKSRQFFISPRSIPPLLT